MKPSRRRLLRPQTARPFPTAKTRVEAFVAYASGECHLSENTVAAYRHNLERFSAWLGGRDVAALSIRNLSDYVGWLHGRGLAPASIARHIVSLNMFFRYLQLEGVMGDNLAELLGSQKLWERRAENLERRTDRPLVFLSGTRRLVVAAQSSAFGIALCDRLPGVGNFQPAASRHSPRRELLHLSRQGRQRTGDAVEHPRRRGVSRLFGRRTTEAGRSLFAAGRLGLAFRIADGDCDASGFGNC